MSISRIDTEKLMCALVNRMESKAAVARALNQSRQKFHYWWNYANKVPYDQILAMKKLLDQWELGETQKKSHKKIGQVFVSKAFGADESIEMDAKLTISERTQWGMRYMAQVGSRQGLRSDKLILVNKHSLFYEKPESLRPNLDEVALEKGEVSSKKKDATQFLGRTDVAVAKKIGFSKGTFLSAKKVVMAGAVELIKAMDEKKISVHKAAMLAKFSKEEQRAQLVRILTPSSSAVKEKLIECKKREGLVVSKAVVPVVGLTLKTESIDWIASHHELLEAERISQLPLRILFMALLLRCDRNGRFQWEVDALKTQAMPFIDIDWEKGLAVLCEWGFIKKTRCRSQVYGYIDREPFFKRQLAR